MYYRMEFWFYKIESLPSENPSITVLCSDSEDYGGEEQVIEHDNLVEEDGENKWVTLRLPMLKQLALWKGNLTCAIEVRGMSVDEVKPNVPLLIMMQDSDAHRRSRRSEDRVERSDACRTVSFNVSFEDIGFGDFIVYPLIYEARLCRGYCLNSQNMHETVVDHAFQRNSSLEKEHGRCWSTCCRPKTYAPLLLVHKKKGSEITIESYFNDMVVTSCLCS